MLVGEYRNGKLLDATYELFGFAHELSAETVLFLAGSDAQLPACESLLYLVNVGTCGEYNPDMHKQMILEAVRRENPDYVVFIHSSYGWDLAPRVAASLKVAQISEVLSVTDDVFEVACCSGKMRRTVRSATSQAVITIQAGAFPVIRPGGMPSIRTLYPTGSAVMEFVGYEQADKGDADLTRAEVVVSAGRGVGKKDNIAVIQALASALGGELGASRPVIDAGWVSQRHQVGTTGQMVAPKLYVACGISGAIQHVAGMKKSDFILAINKDREAPIGEIADVFVVADVMQFVPAMTAKVMK